MRRMGILATSGDTLAQPGTKTCPVRHDNASRPGRSRRRPMFPEAIGKDAAGYIRICRRNPVFGLRH
jgi:hypothetical protein